MFNFNPDDDRFWRIFHRWYVYNLIFTDFLHTLLFPDAFLFLSLVFSFFKDLILIVQEFNCYNRMICYDIWVFEFGLLDVVAFVFVEFILNGCLLFEGRARRDG